MPALNRAWLWLGVVLGVGAISPVRAAFTPSALAVNTSYRWTENISRASGAADFRDAAEYELGGQARFVRQLTPRLLARLDLDVAGWICPEYDLLDRLEFGPRLVLTRKIGLGPEAWVLAAETGLTARTGRLDDADSVAARAGLTLSKRFGPWFSTAVSGSWTGQEAKDAAFAVAHYAAEARVNFDPHPRARFSAGVGRRDGTFTVGASEMRFGRALAGALGPRVASYFATVPTATTELFGPGWVSYSVEAEVEEWWCEFSPVLTDRSSLALRYGRAHFTNRVDIEYRQDTVSLSFLYAF
ncbi:MAG: hypothetical protein NTU80_11380 [Verrucomicrobia bacterium]|nr:hypothetical protein [Verrucomicrobiota bacterium]